MTSDRDAARVFHSTVSVRDVQCRALRRISMESAILIAIVLVSLSSWTAAVPTYLKIVFISGFVIYMMWGIALYPKVKRASQEFSVRLGEDSLFFRFEGISRRIPYKDLEVKEVKRSNGELREITLRTRHGQTIPIQGLEDMSTLHAELETRLQK